MNGPGEIALTRRVLRKTAESAIAGAISIAGDEAMPVYYRMWGDKGSNLNISSMEDSFVRLSRNPSILSDLDEILAWAEDESAIRGLAPQLPFACSLELHAHYTTTDINARLGQADLRTVGQRGVGVIHVAALKAYVLLVTFQKTEREFSPSTMYADYPVSRNLLHWESQSNTTQESATGQNLIRHKELGYTILFFARSEKKRNECALPFSYLGPAELVSHHSEKPIEMVWRLRHEMEVEMFEENRRGG